MTIKILLVEDSTLFTLSIFSLLVFFSDLVSINNVFKLIINVLKKDVDQHF